MSISKRQYDGMNVTLYIEALAEREATSANVVVEKGGGGIRHGRPRLGTESCKRMTGVFSL